MLRFATRNSRANRIVLALCAAALVVVAVNHALAALRGAGDVPRHWAFVGINLVTAAIVTFAARTRWAIVPVAILAAQQTWSHGNDLVRDGDVPSIAVLVFFPILITALAFARPRRTADRTELR